jgi:type VI secretion system FHA domain protein
VERCFDQEAVTIGRSAKNDLSLQDPRRMVSSRHAEIRCGPPHCLVRDVGSKNGTVLNDERLAPGKEYPLRPGDRISIGDFMIDVAVLPSASSLSAPAEPAGSCSAGDDPQKVSDAVYRLTRRYAELSQEEPSRRQQALVQLMQDALQGLDAQEAERVLRGIEARFPVAGRPQPPPPIEQPLEVAPSRPSGVSETVQDACFELVRKYCKDLAPPLSDEFIKQLVERLDRILAVTIRSLAEALGGRHQLAQEFDLNVTEILAWKPNRIKLAEGEKEIAAYLVDPRQASTEMVAKDLEAVFQDLALHQMGLMAGLQACLRGILAELDPVAIERTAKEERGKLPGLPWTLSAEAWNLYKEKHRELSEEEVKLFERILAPHFVSGYLSVQKAKKG